MDWSRLFQVVLAFLPVLMKFLAPLALTGVAGYQGYLVSEGESTPVVGGSIIISSLIAAITSLLGGVKLSEFSDAAVLKALNFLDAAIDKAAGAIKDMIRQRLLSIMQRLFQGDAEAEVAFDMLGTANSRLAMGRSPMASLPVGHPMNGANVVYTTANRVEASPVARPAAVAQPAAVARPVPPTAPIATTLPPVQ